MTFLKRKYLKAIEGLRLYFWFYDFTLQEEQGLFMLSGFYFWSRVKEINILSFIGLYYIHFTLAKHRTSLNTRYSWQTIKATANTRNISLLWKKILYLLSACLSHLYMLHALSGRGAAHCYRLYFLKCLAYCGTVFIWLWDQPAAQSCKEF